MIYGSGSGQEDRVKWLDDASDKCTFSSFHAPQMVALTAPPTQLIKMNRPPRLTHLNLTHTSHHLTLDLSLASHLSTHRTPRLTHPAISGERRVNRMEISMIVCDTRVPSVLTGCFMWSASWPRTICMHLLNLERLNMGTNS